MNKLLAHYLAYTNSDIWPAHQGAGGVKGLVISFFIMILVLAVVAGLIWFIETYIYKASLPDPVRLVIAILLVALVIIWACTVFF